MTTSGFDLFVIGGSAGALEPLLEITSVIPAELEIPIAVVLHLTPSQPSLVPPLLARESARRIREAEDKEPLQPHTIYIAPPNYHMLVERTGTLALSVDDPVNFSRPSVDVLFESAADAFGARLIGLVLSGANADGAAGLRRIADAGGLALVQSVASAAYPTMPAAAAQLVPAARIITPSTIGSVLARLAALPSLAEPMS
jgi:two-component system chemotaxis response regulator CheB